ncbi:hypothetical protein sos41_31880 [Alphaproteobacteria bacterium SO-S41]|nr:hypothetical protein sos41_31880 [Alphaproteobacteria bacterium SO-S41]
MKTLLKWLAALVVGVALGAGSLWYMVFKANPAPMITVGIWHMNPLAGSAASDPYSRLYIAITSILALNKSETIYFEAKTDNEGGRLSSACDYTLTGPPPAARWWSVTAYGDNDMLIPTESARYSASAAGATTNADGNVEIALTPAGDGPNGIATGNGNFTLLLRLYQPAEDVAAAPETAPLFTLKKGACRA